MADDDAVDLNTTTLADEQTARCPFAYYTAMRERAPVHRDPTLGFTWVAKRADIAAASRDCSHFSSASELQIRRRFMPKAQALWDAAGMRVVDTLLTTDAPEHEDFRRLGLALFPPAKVNDMTPLIERTIHELIDGFVDDGHVDFVRQFAALLPATIMSDEYGFPREDRARFKHWTDAWISLQTPTITEDEEAALIEHVLELFRYLRERIAKAHETPSERAIHVITSMNRKDGTPFTELEREWMTLVVFIAGNETTVNTLSSCLYRLAIRPDIQQELRADPSRIANFVEEVLRFDPAVQVLVRKAKADVELSGHAFKRGDDIMLCTASGNRDEAFWGDDASEFRHDRANARQHMTFGYGPHACVGMHLARRELICAVRILLERLEHISLANPQEPPRFLPLPFFRGLTELPLRFKIGA